MNKQSHLVLVTGGGGPIGRGIAEAFGRKGNRVVVIDVNAESAQQTADAVKAAGGEGMVSILDVANPKAVGEAIQSLAADQGPIHVLVNNAAVISMGPFEEISEREWDKAMRVNLAGPFVMTQACSRHMENGAVVVNIGSVAGEHPMTNRAHYCVSKAGVHSLTRAMALELAPKGIRVVAIAPKAIISGMSANWISASTGKLMDPGGWVGDPTQKDHVMKTLPVGRSGQPADIAEAVLFLSSEGAGYVTGSLLYVDGGYLAGDTLTK
jgi:NAD(P)-dependent dehydrogenase (short-subunit alcohol dehydrogenase family)